MNWTEFSELNAGERSDKDNINLSVVIPVYNVENYLPTCLDSLMQQGELRLEIILVDDGSTDRSGAVAVRYARQDPRIKVIHQENRGASAARNAGLEMAQGEYIVFLDSDDWVRENSLCELYHEAVKHQADVVMGNILYYDDGIIKSSYKPVPVEIRNIPFSGKEGYIRTLKNNVYSPMACNYIYRRNYLEKIHARFEEGVMHEDELWTPVVLCQAGKMVAVDVDFYYYRQRENSVTHSATHSKHLDSLFRVVDRLFEFAGRFEFSGENGELKNWLYVNIFKLYSWTLGFLPKLKDSSYAVPPLHLDCFWRDCREMTPEPQRICRVYYYLAVSELQKYTGWRTSDWVASIAPQINTGKRLILIYNVIPGEDLSLKTGDVPADWLITTDRRYFQQADAVVFYLPDLLRELENDLDKPEGQVWVSWQLAETEKNYPLINDPEIKNLFDSFVYYPEDETRKEHPLIQLCRTISQETSGS